MKLSFGQSDYANYCIHGCLIGDAKKIDRDEGDYLFSIDKCVIPGELLLC